MLRKEIATPQMLKAFRCNWRLTQPEMVDLLGVSWQTISRWERAAQPIRHPRILYLALSDLQARFRRRRRQRQQRMRKTASS